MDEKTAIFYIRDLATHIKEKALEAKRNADGSNDLFDKGVQFAYHDVISLMQLQAEAFDISLEDIDLSDIAPDTDVL